MVLRVLKGIEERNSLSGKEGARSESDLGSKIGYNGEVLAGASRKGGAVKAGEYRGKFYGSWKKGMFFKIVLRVACPMRAEIAGG